MGETTCEVSNNKRHSLEENEKREQRSTRSDKLETSDQLLTQPSSGFGSICWLNMVPNNGGSRASGMDQIDTMPSTSPNNGVNTNGATNGRLDGGTNGLTNNSRMINNGNFMPQRGGRIHPHNSSSQSSSSTSSTASPSTTGENTAPSPTKDPNNCFVKAVHKLISVIKWVFNDFRLKHLIWIKFIFFFQSASMTVLYPFLNLHMKSLGLSIQEVAIINAVIPVLFIFTPPLTGFLAKRCCSFRVMLSVLTALGGFAALGLLAIPPGRDTTPYPKTLNWGISCGRPNNRARFQKLMLHGFRRDECNLNNWIRPNGLGPNGLPLTNAATLLMENITFTPGTCGYLCPTSLNKMNDNTGRKWTPKFAEYKVIWPNRGGGFGISEIVDVVQLDTPEAKAYHEPDVIDDNIFFPMNWTFYLSCDRIRPQDCIFSPIQRAPPSDSDYSLRLRQVSSPFRSPEVGPSFDVLSIMPPHTQVPVTTPINCGAKEVVAQVVSTLDTSSLSPAAAIESAKTKGAGQQKNLVETRFPSCRLHCLVNIERASLCNNTHAGVIHDTSLTFWVYLSQRTLLGVFSAASLMMFEGAVMATIQEMGGDYGIQRFVGNFGAIMFAPLGGYMIDAASTSRREVDFSPVIYTYLALKLMAAVMIFMVKLEFKPPGERMLANIKEITRNAEVVAFLIMMMFAGTFWGYIEAFLFWYLDDLYSNMEVQSSRFIMGWTVAVGMVTSLPFLVFSGPITDSIGHMNVIVIGMLAYFARLLGYSFVENPVYVYPFEALEGLTMALMMTSAVTYVAKISTPNTIASIMGIMGALFFGVGKGVGALFGGTLMTYFGAEWTFRYFAINAAICALTYALFECLYVKPKKRRDADPQGSGENVEHGSNGQVNGKPKSHFAQNILQNHQNGKNSGKNNGHLEPPTYASAIHDENFPAPPPSSTLNGSSVPMTPPKSSNPSPPPPPPPLNTGEDVTDSMVQTTGPRSITAGTRV